MRYFRTQNQNHGSSFGCIKSAISISFRPVSFWFPTVHALLMGARCKGARNQSVTNDGDDALTVLPAADQLHFAAVRDAIRSLFNDSYRFYCLAIVRCHSDPNS